MFIIYLKNEIINILRLFNKTLSAVIIIAVLSISAHALQKKQIEREKPPPYNKLRVGVSLLSLAHPFFFELEKGLQDAAYKKGHNDTAKYENEKKYELIVVGAEYDIEKQIRQLEDFIIQDVDAIIVNPSHKDSICPVIYKANRAGIPVFTVDTGINEHWKEDSLAVVFHVATNNLVGGQKAAEAIIDGFKERFPKKECKVIMLIEVGMTSSDDRVDGFKAKIVELTSDTTIFKIEGGAAREIAYNKMKNILKNHKFKNCFRGIFAINDEIACGAYDFIKDSKRDSIILVGFDGSQDAKERIEKEITHKDSTIFYDTIQQYPRWMGRCIFKEVVKYFSNEKGKEKKQEELPECDDDECTEKKLIFTAKRQPKYNNRKNKEPKN